MKVCIFGAGAVGGHIATRLMAEKARVIAEGAGALSLAAALTGQAGDGPIVAIVSGGNIDLDKYIECLG